MEMRTNYYVLAYDRFVDHEGYAYEIQPPKRKFVGFIGTNTRRGKRIYFSVPCLEWRLLKAFRNSQRDSYWFKVANPYLRGIYKYILVELS